MGPGASGACWATSTARPRSAQVQGAGLPRPRPGSAKMPGHRLTDRSTAPLSPAAGWSASTPWGIRRHAGNALKHENEVVRGACPGRRDGHTASRGAGPAAGRAAGGSRRRCGRHLQRPPRPTGRRGGRDAPRRPHSPSAASAGPCRARVRRRRAALLAARIPIHAPVVQVRAPAPRAALPPAAGRPARHAAGSAKRTAGRPARMAGHSEGW